MTGTAVTLGPMVVGFDGSPASVRAARLAIALARAAGSRLLLVYAHRPDPRLAEPRTEEEAQSPVRAVERAMGALVQEAGEAGVAAEAATREGEPDAVLRQLAASRGAALLLVGTRGLGGAAKVVLGSVSARLVASATVPLTIVP